MNVVLFLLKFQYFLSVTVIALIVLECNSGFYLFAHEICKSMTGLKLFSSYIRISPVVCRLGQQSI